ncbi:hypothetical protein [Rhizobium grahamii]|nr:hypothetical protein [Rhizobium grahamii]
MSREAIDTWIEYPTAAFYTVTADPTGSADKVNLVLAGFETYEG